MDEQLLKKKKLQAEALGKMIYDENFHGSTEGGVNVPAVRSSGLSFAYPSGLNPKEKEAFDAYVRKLKRESEGMD